MREPVQLGRTSTLENNPTNNPTTIVNVNKSAKTGAKFLGCFPIAFGSIFVIAGLAVIFLAGLQPLIRWYQGFDWVEAPCEITSASVKVHDGDDGDTYSPEVTYTYIWKGEPYQGNRFAWDETSYGSRSSIEKWMAPYPVGAKTECYVDADNPREAVLVRSFPTIVLFIVPFGLIFVAVGSAVAWGVPRLMARQQAMMQKINATPSSSAMRATVAPEQTFARTQADDPDAAEIPISTVVPHETGDANEPLIIQPSSGRWGALVAMLLICGFWNGIVSVFLFSIFGQKGGMPIFSLLFLTPFLLIGLGLMVAVVYSFLALFNPQPVLVCSDRWLYAGSEFELSWMMKGNSAKVRKLTVFLEGTESVTYRQGTSTRTESNVFYSITVAEVTEPAQIAEGYHLVTIPENTMHTFEAANNKIQWQVRFAGQIPWWPDVTDSFPITILPPLPYRKDV